VTQTAGGQSLQPSLTIANHIMTEIVAEVMNWKWNRFNLPVFYTNSWQQDYALNVVNLGWLEHGYLVDINNTGLPKPVWPLEVVKDLEATSGQYGQPGQVSWLPNDQLYFGTWGGAVNTGDGTYGNNPQPLQTINSPLGVVAQIPNPILQVKDTFGNYWVVTGYGTTGSTNPFLSNLNPVFPTPANPSIVATTATDGSVTWTAVNPKGQGIRCSPIPPQAGVVYQFNLVGQWRPFAFLNGGAFTSFSQTIEPIPDDYANFFFDGFVAKCYMHSPDKAIRGMYEDQMENWRKSMMKTKEKSDRERDNAGFYPASSIMHQPYTVYPGPAYPFMLPYGG